MNYAQILLDESGSMSGQEQRVVTGINEYLKSLENSAPGCQVRIVAFDSNRWHELRSGEVSAVPALLASDYNPGAMTPLYDALSRLIDDIEQKASASDKVMIIVDTDGMENHSKEHTTASIKARIDTLKTRGWEFTFLASGITEQAAAVTASSYASLGVPVMKSAHVARNFAYGNLASSTTEHFNK